MMGEAMVVCLMRASGVMGVGVFVCCEGWCDVGTCMCAEGIWCDVGRRVCVLRASGVMGVGVLVC